jgi:ribosomal protein L29|tara:strand:- start:1048 stop:1218 length:171 start_codon:yes stop_codon:yes gene_type:complete
MLDKKTMTKSEAEKKIRDLKIELLKQPTKKKSIKREIARLLTINMKNNQIKSEKKS